MNILRVIKYHILRLSAYSKKIVQYYTKQEIAVVGYSPFGHIDFPSSNSNKEKVLAKIANIHIPISICYRTSLNR